MSDELPTLADVSDAFVEAREREEHFRDIHRERKSELDEARAQHRRSQNPERFAAEVDALLEGGEATAVATAPPKEIETLEHDWRVAKRALERATSARKKAQEAAARALGEELEPRYREVVHEAAELLSRLLELSDQEERIRYHHASEAGGFHSGKMGDAPGLAVRGVPTRRAKDYLVWARDEYGAKV